MKLNILTPGFKTPNGTAFLFPFLVWRQQLKSSGIYVQFFDSLDSSLYECDFLCVDSKFFASRWIKFRDETEGIFKDFSDRVEYVLYFDTTDSTGMDNTYPLPYVNAWIKNQLLLDLKEYLRPIYSNGRIFADFVYKEGFAIDSNQSWSVPIPNIKDLRKLKLGWNSGLANYSLFGPLRTKILEKLGLKNFVKYSKSFVSPSTLRLKPISSRFGVNYIHESVSWHRRSVSKLLGADFKTNKINRYEYFKEISSSKVVISPFGLGEITLKDFEVFLSGSLLFKPSMDHMHTWPPFFIKDQTYFDYRWDLNDFKEKLLTIIDDDRKRISIAKNAQNNYIKYTISPIASELFIGHLNNILSETKLL